MFGKLKYDHPKGVTPHLVENLATLLFESNMVCFGEPNSTLSPLFSSVFLLIAIDCDKVETSQTRTRNR